MTVDLNQQPALAAAFGRLNRLKPDRFEIYLSRKASTTIESRNQEIETFSRAEDVGLSIRIIKDRRLGFSFTTSLEAEAVRRAVESAFEIAQAMPADEFVNLPSFSIGKGTYPQLNQFDAAGLNVALSRKIEIAKELEAEARAADKRVTGVRSAALSEQAFETHLVDSEGGHLEERSTLFTAAVTVKAEEAGDSQVGDQFGFSSRLDRLNIREVAQTATLRATELLGAGAAPTLKCPAILRNSVVADLVSFIGDSFSAEQIAKGRSMLGGKMDRKIFASGVSLIDDGLLADGYATSAFDGEGIPSSRTLLVRDGKMTGILCDSYYAKKMGTRSTGNAARSIKSTPVIAATNLFMEAGQTSPSALLEGISKGILITELVGVHTANEVTGDFSLGASGILIENGKLTRPVRGFAVAGNVLDVFSQIVDTGNDLKFFGGTGAPSVRIREISVGGS